LQIDGIRDEKCALEMLATLWKPAGFARTCGLGGINRAAISRDELANPCKTAFYVNSRTRVEAGIEQWQRLIG